MKRPTYYILYSIAALASLALLSLMSGCSGSEPYPVGRLDRMIATYGSMDAAERDSALAANAAELAALAALTGDSLASPSALAEAWSGSTATGFFQAAVDSVFPDLDRLESKLGQLYAAAGKQGVALPRYRITAVTWPSYRPMALRDSTVFVALNHYLGPGYEAYSDFEPYQRALKEPARLSSDLASGIIRSAYPYTSTTGRAFEHMLYDGAVAYVQMKLLGSRRLDRALGLTEAQVDYLEANEARLWQEFGLRPGLLYSTDPADIRSIMDLGAGTGFDGGRAPGGLGRYIGYSMVKSYVDEHPATPLSYLLTPAFYGAAGTLVESGYNPK